MRKLFHPKVVLALLVLFVEAASWFAPGAGYDGDEGG